MARERRKLLGKNSSLTVGTATATALAAITTSIVSTQLNGVLNSLALAGIISVISAIAGEVYRNLIANTTEKTKELLAEHLEVSGPTEETTVLPAVTAEETENLAPADEAETGPEKDQPLLEVDEAELSERSDPEAIDPDSQQPEARGFLAKLRLYLRRNRYMQYVLMFSGIVVLTSLINLWIFPDSANNYYYNTHGVQGELTEQDEQTILETLREEIRSGTLTSGTDSALGSEQTGESNSQQDQTPPTDEAADLQTKIDDLTAENEDLKQQLSGLQTILDELSSRLAQLEQQAPPAPSAPSTPEQPTEDRP